MPWRHSSEIRPDADIPMAMYLADGCTVSVGRDDQGLRVLVHLGASDEPLTLGRPVPVRYQVEDGAPVEEAWSAAPDGRGAFARDPDAFARLLAAEGGMLTLDLIDDDGGPRRCVIDLDGAAAAIDPVLQGRSRA